MSDEIAQAGRVCRKTLSGIVRLLDSSLRAHSSGIQNLCLSVAGRCTHNNDRKGQYNAAGVPEYPCGSSTDYLPPDCLCGWLSCICQESWLAEGGGGCGVPAATSSSSSVRSTLPSSMLTRVTFCLSGRLPLGLKHLEGCMSDHGKDYASCGNLILGLISSIHM